MLQFQHDLLDKFSAAIVALDQRFADDSGRLEDQNVDAELRGWLDGKDEPLPWAGSRVMPDEWFFIKTLYGQETRDQQRRHIRQYYPLFVKLAQRDVRNLTPNIMWDWTLRGDWMKARLCRMAGILLNGNMIMS